MDRFGVVFDGKSYFIVDKQTQDWYKMDSHKKALLKKRAWEYENDAIEGGKITDRGTYV